MIFTEYEMTLAVQGAAKQALSVQAAALGQEDFDADATFAGLGAYERYQFLSNFGDIVLPVLAELPEVAVEPGAKPEFSQPQVEAAVDASLEAARATGQMDQTNPAEQAMLRSATCGVVGWALAALPVRKNDDVLVVPDTLEGL